MNISITLGDVKPEELPGIVAALHAQRGETIAEIIDNDDTPPPPTEEKAVGGTPEDDTPPPPVEDGTPPPPEEGVEDPVTDTPPADVELDADDLPWDERIHSSGKSKMKTGKRTGTWTRRRGVKPAEVDKVEAELRLIFPLTDAGAEPEGDPGVDAAAEEALRLLSGGAAAADIQEVTYASLMGVITKGVGVDKNLDPIAVNAMLKEKGLADVAELQSHPELFVEVDAALKEMLPA